MIKNFIERQARIASINHLLDLSKKQLSKFQKDESEIFFDVLNTGFRLNLKKTGEKLLLLAIKNLETELKKAKKGR